ncbi:hypothetical protein CH296_26675 [Rhodococcus sp. 14-2496-1d]|uniref:alpha/beta fold hydrolase n=1 Tax=Rhodococcus sp. 14-2496-1d TaxID=2023146 RepID=UPI000B9C54D4|nr:alpha/beta fold hydrolase [Rhodococcus sp. 14-2496-1d]OZF25700.1 hypothetical protein CH296_26675 [Rhodococcus sp. 14-2496-1d]
MTSDIETDVTLVLVHGACHGPWCWEDVVGPLTECGWKVDAVELPLESLYGDAEVVSRAVRDAQALGGRVLLVGHSYGGAVVTEGGSGADALVYLAGSMLDEGDSCASVFPRIDTPELADAVILSSDEKWIELHPQNAVPAFYNRCRDDQVARSLRRLRPFGIAAQHEKITTAAWRTVPTSYIVCTDDRAMAPAYQRELAALVGDSVELDADHSAFYSATDQVVDRLDELARRVAGRT